MSPDATSWYELLGTFDVFRKDGDRGESGFVWLKARATGMAVEIGWERKLVRWGRLVKNK